MTVGKDITKRAEVPVPGVNVESAGRDPYTLHLRYGFRKERRKVRYEPTERVTGTRTTSRVKHEGVRWVPVPGVT